MLPIRLKFIKNIYHLSFSKNNADVGRKYLIIKAISIFMQVIC